MLISSSKIFFTKTKTRNSYINSSAVALRRLQATRCHLQPLMSWRRGTRANVACDAWPESQTGLYKSHDTRFDSVAVPSKSTKLLRYSSIVLYSIVIFVLDYATDAISKNGNNFCLFSDNKYRFLDTSICSRQCLSCYIEWSELVNKRSQI